MSVFGDVEYLGCVFGVHPSGEVLREQSVQDIQRLTVAPRRIAVRFKALESFVEYGIAITVQWLVSSADLFTLGLA